MRIFITIISLAFHVKVSQAVDAIPVQNEMLTEIRSTLQSVQGTKNSIFFQRF